ncbi:MAG TPA: 1,4-dihydroxy-2-naphthoate polyprenyltransferase [Candidatus Binataceae bacterium]|nr:1,4-dihydroxy-2-naphthoate polyprenyltransferase [Candidatus Binataceae bacterium]
MTAQAQAAAFRINPARAWWMAVRVPTLPAAVVPVLVGSALAARDHRFSSAIFIAVLAASVLIQIGTNLTNDLADFRKGADTSERVGPIRVTQAGILSPRAVATGSVVSFGLATALGIYLAIQGGWPIVAVGVACVLAGITYTAGPWPYGYHALGDLICFIFFGLVAVLGTYYLYARALTALAWLLSLPVAALVTAILVVNNLRDLQTDQRTGKHTLATIIGRTGTQLEYFALLASAYLVVLIVVARREAQPWALLAWLTLPMAARLARELRAKQGAALNPVLKATARLHLLFGLLLALGLIL